MHANPGPPIGPRSVLLVCATALVVLVQAVLVRAQTSTWPPFTSEELALKEIPNAPGAMAVLLDREVFQDDTKKIRRERYRIKIFREEGKKYADVVIPYWPRETDVVEARGRTIRADGSIIEFSGQPFDRVIVKTKRLKFRAKVYTLPGVETGSIIEYAYTLRSRADWPDWMKRPFSFLIQSAWTQKSAVWTLQHELYTKHARFTIQPLQRAAPLLVATIRMPVGAAIKRQPDGSAELDLRDLAALEQEDFMPPEDMVNSRVHWYYAVGLGPGSPPEIFWQSYGKTVSEYVLDKYIGEFKSIRRLTEQLISPSDSTEQKLRKLYTRVQQVRYVSYEPWLTEQEQHKQNLKENKNVEEVLEHGYAYANEINLLFVAMARAAGFQAWIVQVADRSKDIFDPAVLDSSRLDAKVVLIRDGDKDLFFDPSTRFCGYGFVPWFESGIMGVRLDKFGGSYVRTPGQRSETAVTRRSAKLKIDREGTLAGELEVSFTGNEALTRRLEFYEEDAAGRRKAIEDELKGWLPGGAVVTVDRMSEWESSDDELRVISHISVPGFGVIMGRRILVPGAVFQSTHTHPLQHPKRTHPIYFRFAYQQKDDVTIEIPQGFRVESVPETLNFAVGELFTISSRFTVRGSILEFERRFSMNGFIFPPSIYSVLKTGFNTVVTNDGNKVVLQQIETAQR